MLLGGVVPKCRADLGAMLTLPPAVARSVFNVGAVDKRIMWASQAPGTEHLQMTVIAKEGAGVSARDHQAVTRECAVGQQSLMPPWALPPLSCPPSPSLHCDTFLECSQLTLESWRAESHE